MLLPPDTQSSDWEQGNLRMWSDTDILDLAGEYPEGTSYSVQLAPLDAKALHVLGLLVQTFNAAGHMLYLEGSRPWGNFYVHAFLLACTAIELLARCRKGDQDLRSGAGDALKEGFRIIGLDKVGAGDLEYDANDLLALRDLAAHGQGLASEGRRRRPVFVHIDLLNGFPDHLKRAFDDYLAGLLDPGDQGSRKMLARSGVEPVSYYARRPGQAFIPPLEYAYENIFISQRPPSQVLQHTDWQVYKGK